MVSRLDYRSSGLDSSPGQGHCVVFWVRHSTLKVPLFNQLYKWVLVNKCWGITLQWTSLPSRGEYKYS